jgi:pimeloyl-ACP methyl ester carboxylesterase
MHLAPNHGMAPGAFRIRVDDAVLADLARRLRRTRWTSLAPGDTWELGVSRPYLERLVAYWSNGYSWRRQEAELNQLPQFTADIDGARLHFVHQPADRPQARALLLLHGWPDSFHRFHKVIPRLSRSFHVVVPSLPGFGFTGRIARPSPEQPTRYNAQLLWRLMTELGHRRFVVAGGDGGSVLAQRMAIDHPESVAAIHLTDLGWHAGNVDPSALPHHEKKYLERLKKRFMTDGAYAALQASKPASLAPALADSPSGLAAWIVDRFHAWCDDLDGTITPDELLTNIMIYWVTSTIGPSMDSYRADAASPSLTPADRVDVPVGLALFPGDIGGIPPRSFAERTLNVQRWTEMPRGGHFAALEQPELYAGDLEAFFATTQVARASAREGNRDAHRAV